MEDGNRHILRAIAYQLERIADNLSIKNKAGNDSSFIDNMFRQSMFKPLLEKSIEEMNLSTRTLNCLQAEGVRTIGDLIQKEATAMLRYKNFGKKCLSELYWKLKLDYGINKESFRTDYQAPKDNIDAYLKERELNGEG